MKFKFLSSLSGFLLLTGVCVTPLLGGCMSYRFANTIELPANKTGIYVPVFVDETVEGNLGMELASAVRGNVLRRHPRILRRQIGEGAVVLDGTVKKMRDRPLFSGAGGKLVAGTYRVSVEVSVKLRDHKGKLLAKLGAFSSSEEYITEKAMELTEEGRKRAIRRVALQLADQIVRKLDQAQKGKS